MIKLLASLVIQLAQICERKDIELGKKIHAFDLKSNEWHIAFMQIYETLFRQEAEIRNERGEIKFDWQGNLILDNDDDDDATKKIPTLCAALKPLLEFIEGYRRRVAAPSDTMVHKKYTKYADLTYISTKMRQVETETYGKLLERKMKELGHL